MSFPLLTCVCGKGLSDGVSVYRSQALGYLAPSVRVALSSVRRLGGHPDAEGGALFFGGPVLRHHRLHPLLHDLSVLRVNEYPLPRFTCSVGQDIHRVLVAHDQRYENISPAGLADVSGCRGHCRLGVEKPLLLGLANAVADSVFSFPYRQSGLVFGAASRELKVEVVLPFSFITLEPCSTPHKVAVVRVSPVSQRTCRWEVIVLGALVSGEVWEHASHPLEPIVVSNPPGGDVSQELSSLLVTRFACVADPKGHLASSLAGTNTKCEGPELLVVTCEPDL